MNLGVRRIGATDEDVNIIDQDRVAVKFIYDCKSCGVSTHILQPSTSSEVDGISSVHSCSCGKRFKYTVTNPEVAIEELEEEGNNE